MLEGLDWIPHIGDAGVAVAILATIIFVFWALIQIVKQWRAVAMARIEMEREDRRKRREMDASETEQRLAIEHERAKAEDRQAAIMGRLELTLDGMGKTISRLMELFGTVPTRGDLQDMEQAVRVLAGEHDHRLDLALEQIKAVPRETWRQGAPHVAALRDDIQAVPGAVWEVGDPKLAGLSSGIRADLEPLIADLKETFDDGFRRIEDGIAARLDAMGEEISPALRGMINQELSQYQRQTQRQFENMVRLLDALREDIDRRDGDARAGKAAPSVTNGTPGAEGQASGEAAAPPESNDTQEKEHGTR